MLDINVLSIKFSKWWLTIKRPLRRWWRTIPYTTTDAKERAWRKKWLKECLWHEWKFIKSSSWFDWLVPKEKRSRRHASRMFWRMNHPHSGTRQLTNLYVSHVGISSGR